MWQDPKEPSIPDEEVVPYYPKPTVIIPKLHPFVAVKVYALAKQIKPRVPPRMRQGRFLIEVKELIGVLITEESTDSISGIVKSVVPWGLGWPVGIALDHLLPEKLLAVIYYLLDGISD